MKTSKALHFCALQPNAKQWNHQSRLRSPVKLHQLEQLVATKVSHHLVCMCIRFLYCFYEIDWKCWYFCLANQFLFDVFCLSCLHRSWPVLLTRHWWQSHRAPNAKEYAPGGHLIVRQWSLLNAGSVSMGIYGVYLLSIYHICICCGCVNIYIYTYILHTYIYIYIRLYNNNIWLYYTYIVHLLYLHTCRPCTRKIYIQCIIWYISSICICPKHQTCLCYFAVLDPPKQ